MTGLAARKPKNRKIAPARLESCCIRAPFGALKLTFADERLKTIDFMPPGSRPKAPKGGAQRAAVAQVRRYLCDPQANFTFDFPEDMGTPFQRRVWKEVMGIPPGSTRSYGDVARRLRTAPRAIGGAMGANPLPVMIPCHRVVGRSGLGGFMGADQGWGMAVKKWLLDHERVPQFR